MKKELKMKLAGSLVVICTAAAVFAHCQIPCGIYGDAARFTLMKEHVTTIEKSMKEIVRIGKERKPDNNQLVRWVTNKEAHADELAEIVTSYFMSQRIKPAPEGKKDENAAYVEKLSLLHQILIGSMKAKQTTDLEVCAKLREHIDQFEKSYMAK